MTTEPGQPVNHTAIRMSRTPLDMAKAVLVLLVPVALLVAAYVFFLGGNNAIVIDPSGAYSQARAAAQFRVLEPEGLSAKWKPVSSSYGGGVLRVGYITPSGDGIQLVESARTDSMINTELGATDQVATAVGAGGLSWGRLTLRDKPGRALVSSETGRTVIIKGQATFEQLKLFAEALK